MSGLLDPPPPNGNYGKDSPLAKHAKTLTIVGALVTAIYGATKPESKGQKAIAQGQKGYEALRSEVQSLQKWVRYNRARAKKAETQCKAEAAALTALVTGFMFGASDKKKATAARETELDHKTLQSFIKALQTAAAKKPDEPEPPKLKAPPTAAKALK